MNIEKVSIFFIVVLASGGILLLARFFLFKIINRWAQRTKTVIDNLIIDTIKVPSIFWCIGIALYIGIESSEFSSKYTFYVIKLIHILIIFSITVAVANLINRLFIRYVERSSISVQSTGLLNVIIKGAIYVIGLILILHIVGVSIAPLITTLGIGGIAVALALKDTLENLFAGIHIMAEKTVRVGDFIRLENGQEGFVEDISWRTTRIRMIPNNMIILPNSKLAQSIMVNYFLPEKRSSIQIPVSVSYEADPEKVEKILLEEATKATEEVPGLLKEPEPVVRLIPGFGENSLDFTLVCHIEDISYQYSVQHELRKRIFKRFKQEGITIPYPQRVVLLRSDKTST
jgi:small-conductance mechanosensitive channel